VVQPFDLKTTEEKRREEKRNKLCLKLGGSLTYAALTGKIYQFLAQL